MWNVHTVEALVAAIPAMSTMGAGYSILLIVGGGLLVISTLFGGDSDAGLDVEVDVDFDADIDFDADLDADIDGDALGAAGEHASWLSLSNWFSMQFMVYFAAACGLVGTVLTFLTDMSELAVAAWAVLGGLVIGQGAHQALNSLRRSSGNTQALKHDFLRKIARVTLAVRPPQRGEVAVHVKGVERFVPAKSKRPDDTFEVADSVVIVGFHNGTAEVVSRREYEFLTNSKTGGSDE